MIIVKNKEPCKYSNLFLVLFRTRQKELLKLMLKGKNEGCISFF